MQPPPKKLEFTLGFLSLAGIFFICGGLGSGVIYFLTLPAVWSVSAFPGILLALGIILTGGTLGLLLLAFTAIANAVFHIEHYLAQIAHSTQRPAPPPRVPASPVNKQPRQQ